MFNNGPGFTTMPRIGNGGGGQTTVGGKTPLAKCAMIFGTNMKMKLRFTKVKENC